MEKSNNLKPYKGYYKNKYFLFISAFIISVSLVVFIFILKNELNTKKTENDDIEFFYKSFIKNNPYDIRHYITLSDFYKEEKNNLSNKVKINGKSLIQNQMLKRDRKIVKIKKNYSNTKNNIYNISEHSILNTHYIDNSTANTNYAEFITISQAFEKKQYQKIIDTINKYRINDYKKNSDIFIFLADAYYMLEKYDDAFYIFKDLLRLGNTNVYYINGKIGNILYTQKDYAKAYEYYMESIKTESDNCSIKFNIAKIFIKDGKTDEALKILASVINRHKNQKNDIIYNSYLESANIYLSLSAYSQAIASYLQASNIKKDYKIFQSIAISYEMLKDKENAQLYYKKALQLEEREDLYYSMARLKYSENKYGQTIKYLKKCLEINPNNIKAYLLLSDCFIKIKEYDHAINTLEYAITNEYKHHSIYTKMALILYNNKNEPDNAIKMLNKSIEIDSKVLTNYTILSDIYLTVGNTNEAIASYKNALYIDSDNMNIKYELANVYYESKLYKEAEQIFEDIITEDPRFIKNLMLYMKN